MADTGINLFLAFIEGLGLIVSPCILPILPLMLSGSLEGSKKRPIGIIIGFILTFTLFTFFSKKLIELTGIDLELIRNIAFLLLILIAMIMISTILSEKFNFLTRKLSNVGSSHAFNKPNGGFFSGVGFGGLVALIWTPCAGPILAAVIVQTVIQTTTLQSFFTLLFFAVGAGIPMLLIVIFGRELLLRFTFLKKHSIFIRQLLGLIILLSVIFLYFSNSFIPTSKTYTASEMGDGTTLINGLTSPYPAPAIAGISDWINSKPIALSDLKGKVILIDFWTYSCINCIRTLPAIKRWYEKYHDKGLVIIGIHTPEFDFEKKLSNVENAVKKFQLPYPIALDNDYKTWQNFSNQYWPAHYLIDKNGNVVYQHFGEGEEVTMENNIRFLLNLKSTEEKPSSQINLGDLISRQTPETYLGFARASNFSSNESISENIKTHYTFPKTLDKNDWALQGEWTIHNENISSGKNAAIRIHFQAKQVYVVMGSETGKPIEVKLSLNDKPLTRSNKGNDVSGSVIKVSNHTLYEVLSFDKPESGILELSTPEEGLEMYTFTFGNK